MTARPTRFWVEALNVKDVPSGDILSLGDALRQPQIQHRGTLQKVAVPGIGDIEVFGLTALFDKTRAEVETPPPTLGQHNAETLGRFGYTEAQLAELKAKAVI